MRLSAFGAGHDAPTINGRHHALSDSELMASGLAWTIIRPHFFMQNLMMAADGVKAKGKLYFALGEDRMGIIDTRDIGHFVAQLLTTSDLEGKIYTITGPETVSMHDVAADLSSVLNREIRYQPVMTELALAELKSKGLDTYTLNVLRDYFIEYSRNWGDIVTEDYKNVTGAKPRPLKDFILDHADAFRA